VLEERHDVIGGLRDGVGRDVETAVAKVVEDARAGFVAIGTRTVRPPALPKIRASQRGASCGGSWSACTIDSLPGPSRAPISTPRRNFKSSRWRRMRAT
jgi:hypothetical protein